MVTNGSTSASELARRHAEAALEAGAAAGLSADAVARALLNAVIEIYRRERSADDIRRELEFVAEHVEGDADFPFMRP